MPLADAFLDPAQIENEFFFNLAVGVCERCTTVQLCERVPDAYMFHDAYAYYSSTSVGTQRHFAAFADDAVRRTPASTELFAIEIGCNDGVLLERFRARGIRHLGVDPAGNVVAEAARKGLSVRQASFNEGTACDVAIEHGRADVIVAANVICHIADVHSVFAGVRQLLTPSGLFIFEDPYVGSILEQNTFDQIYDEHVFYFSLAAVERIAGMHGLEVIDLCPQPVHGGEMRYYLGVRGAHAPAPSVREWRNREKLSGVCSSPPYRHFAAQAAVIRDTLAETVNRIASDGYRITGYGATAKSCTVINYCGFTARKLSTLRT